MRPTGYQAELRSASASGQWALYCAQTAAYEDECKGCKRRGPHATIERRDSESTEDTVRANQCMSDNVKALQGKRLCV
jgi:hypothetical protein